MTGRDANCLSTWFPRLQAAGVPVPRTEIVRAPDKLLSLLDGREPDGFADFLRQLELAAARAGFPCFLRTGQGSGKHRWRHTCCVPSAGELAAHVAALVEWSEEVDFLGLPHDVWAVREFLHLQTAFTAPLFDDFPVNKERRFFIAGGAVVCHHPYWPPDAVREGLGQAGAPPDWEARLAELNREPVEETAHLAALSRRVAAHFEGAWSLDWCCDVAGKWWAIDMAQAADSWHWPDCPDAARWGWPGT